MTPDAVETANGTDSLGADTRVMASRALAFLGDVPRDANGVAMVREYECAMGAAYQAANECAKSVATADDVLTAYARVAAVADTFHRRYLDAICACGQVTSECLIGRAVSK